MELDSLVTAAQRRALNKLLADKLDSSHPLHSAINNQRSLFRDSLLLPTTQTHRLKNSFVTWAIKLFISMVSGMRGRGKRQNAAPGMEEKD